MSGYGHGIPGAVSSILGWRPGRPPLGNLGYILDFQQGVCLAIFWGCMAEFWGCLAS